MELRRIVNKLLIKDIKNDANIQITNIQYDSRKVTQDTLFICLKGYTVDGHNFIEQALSKGATAFLVQEDVNVPNSVPVIKVPDTRRAMAIISDEFYHSPSAQLNTIGITGTNGKTTTSTLIQEILNDNQKNSGLIGTINIKYGDVTIPSVNTTPDTLELQQIFRTMVDYKMSHVVMEVSSHGLSLGRTRGTNFKTAVFTNFTQDHLDYHKTMEEYAHAKSLLFSQLGNSYHNNPTYAVLNIDDKMAEKYSQITPAQVITYGIKNQADVTAKNIKITSKGTSFTVDSFLGSTEIHTKLIGEFNIYNILASIATCLIEGISLQDIKNSINKIKGVPGRFESVYEGQDFAVIVDYAHTPDSLENVLKTVRKFTKGKIKCVVGCGGDRDSSKRPIMAAIAEKYSDHVILTSDNPRTEDPLSIISDMQSGFKNKNNSEHSIVVDRRKAIEKALSNDSSLLTEGDCVVIAGKGHETYQIIGKDIMYFDDRKVAQEYLTQHTKSPGLTPSN
jgi:UDP-N-acetylmuramoyl-L-alanyl-D-glutamate--2,6-diaminopimelate ligase